MNCASLLSLTPFVVALSACSGEAVSPDAGMTLGQDASADVQTVVSDVALDVAVVSADVVAIQDVVTPDVTIPRSDACVPSTPPTETCNRIDDDCNGLIDDVDVGGDGIIDCLRILILGRAGQFGSSDFRGWLGTQGAAVMRIHDAAGAPALTASDLNSATVVIIDWLQRDYTADESNVLRDWVAAGGGVVAMSGHDGSISHTRVSTLLAGFGLRLVAPLRSGPVTTFAMHPTTTGLSSVTFSGGWATEPVLVADGGVVDTVGVNTVVASFGGSDAGGPAAAVAQVRRAGRVFIWGDEWVSFDSEWRSMPMVRQFWVNVLGWVSHQR